MMIYTSSTWTTVIYMILLLDVALQSAQIHKSTIVYTRAYQGYQVDGRMAQLLQAVPRLFDPWRAIDQGGSSPPTTSFRADPLKAMGWKSVPHWCLPKSWPKDTQKEVT